MKMPVNDVQKELLKSICKSDCISEVKGIINVDSISIFQCGDRMTPLMAAAKYGRLAVLKYLLELRCPVDDADMTGKTALNVAVNQGHLGVAIFLLRCGAAIDHQDKSGMTPLMTCSRSGRLSLVELLLINGAERDVRRKSDGKRAIDFASSMEMRNVLSRTSSRVMHEAFTGNGCGTPLGCQKFVFPTGRQKCMQQVTVNVKQNPVVNTKMDKMAKFNSMGIVGENSYMCSGVCVGVGDPSDLSHSISIMEEASTHIREKGRALMHVREKSTSDGSLLMKCSTNKERIDRERDAIHWLTVKFKGELLPFVGFPPGMNSIIELRAANQCVSKEEHSSCTEEVVSNDGTADNTTCTNIPTSERGRGDAAMTTSGDSHRVWYGLLLEKADCDLHKFGVAFLSKNDYHFNFHFHRHGVGPSTSRSDARDQSMQKTPREPLVNDRSTTHLPPPKPINTRDQCNRDAKTFQGNPTSAETSFFLEDTVNMGVTIDIAVQVCKILTALHVKDVVWLDLKPSNFVLFIDDVRLTENEANIIVKSEEEKEEEVEKEEEKCNININCHHLAGEIDRQTDQREGGSNPKSLGSEKRSEGFISSAIIGDPTVRVASSQSPSNLPSSSPLPSSFSSNPTSSPSSSSSSRPLFPTPFHCTMKAIDLAGCVSSNTPHAPSSLTFTAKFAPPELMPFLVLTLSHAHTHIHREGTALHRDCPSSSSSFSSSSACKRETDHTNYHSHIDDATVSAEEYARSLENDGLIDGDCRLFDVQKSFDCWSLGMLLFQLFQPDFKHFFAQSDMENGQSCANEYESDDDDVENVGTTQSRKMSDYILRKLSQPSKCLQSQIDGALTRSSDGSLKNAREVDGSAASEDGRGDGDCNKDCKENGESECYASASVGSNENKRKIMDKDRDRYREKSTDCPMAGNARKRCNANNQVKSVHHECVCAVDMDMSSSSSSTDRVTSAKSETESEWSPCNPSNSGNNVKVGNTHNTSVTAPPPSRAPHSHSHSHDLMSEVRVRVLRLIGLLLRVHPSERITAEQALDKLEVIQCNYNFAVAHVKGDIPTDRYQYSVHGYEC